MNVSYRVSDSVLKVKLDAEMDGEHRVYPFQDPKSPPLIQALYAIDGIKTIFVYPKRREIYFSRYPNGPSWENLIRGTSALELGINDVLGLHFCPDGVVNIVDFQFVPAPQ